MIRKHERAISWKAGFLAMAVHVALLGILFVSFNWKTKHDALNVTEVELWDNLPSAQPVPPPVTQPEPEPEPPKPEPEIKKEPEPSPVVEEKPDPEPEPEAPKVDIELEKKKKEEELKKKLEAEKQKKLEQKRKKETARKAKQAKIKKIKEQLLKEEQAQKEKAALEKIQRELQAEQDAANQAQASAARASIIGEYTSKIKAKIRGNVNKTLCSDGNPELIFAIGLLPTGEYRGSPKLVKSSGSSACDEAVERAIIVSEPLPLPTDPDALAAFRDLNLKFRPNE